MIQDLGFDFDIHLQIFFLLKIQMNKSIDTMYIAVKLKPHRIGFFSFWSHDPIVRQLIQIKMCGEWHELELKIEVWPIRFEHTRTFGRTSVCPIPSDAVSRTCWFFDLDKL